MPKPTLASLITLDHLRAIDFWGRVDRTGDGCWEWTKGRNDRGYGVVHAPKGVTGLTAPIAIYAHRVAWALHHGTMPSANMVIDHRCYNTACCRPEHLELTTQLANVRRGRKPIRKPAARVGRDGATRWQVRWYEKEGGVRKHRHRLFDSLDEAETFARANRAS